MDRHINAPLDAQTARELRAGDYVYITGIIYTARDAAHLRMDKALNSSLFPWKITLFIIWGRLLQEKADPSVQQDQQRQAAWISMRPDYWILD